MNWFRRKETEIIGEEEPTFGPNVNPEAESRLGHPGLGAKIHHYGSGTGIWAQTNQMGETLVLENGDVVVRGASNLEEAQELLEEYLDTGIPQYGTFSEERSRLTPIYHEFIHDQGFYTRW